MASVAPFQIPRRTVQEIIDGIRRERGASPPRTPTDAVTVDAAERYPNLVTRILIDDAERILAKPSLATRSELELLHKGVKITTEIRRAGLQASAPTRFNSSPDTKPNGSATRGKANEDTISRLAKSMSEGPTNGSAENGDVSPSDTRTPEREAETASSR